MTLNDRAILDDAGRISHEIAKEFAEKEYEKFYQKCLKSPSKADEDFEAFESKAAKFINKRKKKK